MSSAWVWVSLYSVQIAPAPQLTRALQVMHVGGILLGFQVVANTYLPRHAWALLQQDSQGSLQLRLYCVLSCAAAGGRNRKFMRDPATLEYRDNPEHGLRLILTFK